METISTKIVPILKQYGVKKAALFGSYARNEQNSQSDIDILIEPPEGMGLSFVRLKRDIEQELKKEIDLVTYRGLHPLLKEKILSQQKIIL